MCVCVVLCTSIEHSETAQSQIPSLVHLQTKSEEMDMLSAVSVCMMGDAVTGRFMRVIMTKCVFV